MANAKKHKFSQLEERVIIRLGTFFFFGNVCGMLPFEAWNALISGVLFTTMCIADHLMSEDM